MNDRDHFAAAALTGLVANGDYSVESTPMLAWRMADAMLRERDSRTADTTDLDAAPVARAAPSVSSVPLGKGLGTGDTFGPDAYRRFVGEVMNWISEATSIYEPRSDGGRRIMADACMQCWDAFNRIAYPTTNHDAAPAARADSRPPGNPVASAVTGTGKQTAPPCVETDGFSSDSRTGQINRPPECESPRRECGESQRRDVPQQDNCRAAGGPAHHISEKEIDALEFVVEEGRIANIHDYGILRSLLVRLRQEWEFRDSPDPIAPTMLANGVDRPVSYAEIDAKRVDYDTDRADAIAETIRAVTAETDTTPPQNGALSGCETVPDPDSRVFETQRTPQPHATPPQDSVQGEGTEPVAWLVKGAEYDTGCEYEYVTNFKENSEAAAIEGCEVVPLYRHPSPPLGDPEIAVEILKVRAAELETAIRRLADQDATLSVCEGSVTVTMDATLTDAEREAVRFAATAALPETEKLGGVAGELCRMHAATMRGLLERMK